MGLDPSGIKPNALRVVDQGAGVYSFEVAYDGPYEFFPGRPILEVACEEKSDERRVLRRVDRVVRR